MAHTDWNSSLARVLRRTDLAGTVLGSSTVPTSARATYTWKGIHHHIYAKLLAGGITLQSTGNDVEYVAEIEAMMVGAAISKVAEMQQAGSVSDTTRALEAEANAWLSGCIVNPEIMSALGSTVSYTGRPYPSSLAVDSADADFDTDLVEERKQSTLFSAAGDL